MHIGLRFILLANKKVSKKGSGKGKKKGNAKRAAAAELKKEVAQTKSDLFEDSGDEGEEQTKIFQAKAKVFSDNNRDWLKLKKWW